jgi:hypothetical protein
MVFRAFVVDFSQQKPYIKYMKFSFGSDPEFMLTKDGKFYSAIGILPSSGQFHYYNVLAECKIPPGRTEEEVLHNFRECFREFAQLVKPYKLTIRASQDYPEDQLRHKDAKKAGCKDEHCPYTMRQLVPPELETTLQRTAGGHVHLGANGRLQDTYKVFPVGAWDAAKALDLIVGISSVFLDPDPTSIERKRLFGHAGRYRKTEYGIEYRTLSNFWLASPKTVSIMYRLCHSALEFIEDNHEFWTLDESMLEEQPPSWCHKYTYSIESVQYAINKCDEDIAYYYFVLMSKWIPYMIWKEVEIGEIKREYNFYKEWQL